VNEQKLLLAQKEAITPSQVQPSNHNQRARRLRKGQARVSKTNRRTKHSQSKEETARVDRKCVPPITERIRINTTGSLFSNSGHNFQLPEGFGGHENIDDSVTDDTIVTGKLNWGTNLAKQTIPDTTLLRTTTAGQAAVAESKASETTRKRKAFSQAKVTNKDHHTRKKRHNDVERERSQARALVRTFIQSTKPTVDLEYQRTLMRHWEPKVYGSVQDLLFESAVGLKREKNTILSRYEQIFADILH
jgi:hypothetical protein